MQFHNQLYSVMLGAQCIRLSMGNVSDQELHCFVSKKSVENMKALVQNFSEKTSEHFAI